MMKLLSTFFLTAALYGTEAQADTSLPAATPFAGVDKKLPMLELLPGRTLMSAWIETCNVTAKMAKIDRKMANSLLTASSQHRHCNAVASPL